MDLIGSLIITLDPGVDGLHAYRNSGKISPSVQELRSMITDA